MLAARCLFLDLFLWKQMPAQRDNGNGKVTAWKLNNEVKLPVKLKGAAESLIITAD